MVNRHAEQSRRRLAQTSSRLRSLIHPAAIAPDVLLVSERTGRIGWDAAQALAFRPAEIGEALGPHGATYWFRIEATTPPAWAGHRVDLVWDSGSEATLWRDGAPLQGLNSSRRVRRITAPLTFAASAGELVAVQVELACSDWMGEADPAASHDAAEVRIGRTWHEPADDRSLRVPAVHARLIRCGLAVFDAEAWELAWDFETLRRLEAEHARGLDPAWSGRLLAELDRFCTAWDAGDRTSWGPARTILAGLLATRGAEPAHRVTAVGHAHIDSAWLWPLSESRRKVIRSFANQLALMDRYPEHRFAASSALHYAWLEQDAPALYARVAERIAEGRWEVVGGAWVEPDCNLPSGESLVRQFLYGQRAFAERFARRCRECWSPDTFGHNGQLPQILRGAGIDRFLTQKLSWNQFTQPPHHSFRWEGIDGSAVLAHMPPVDTYNATLDVGELRASVARFRDHDRTALSLVPFGHGDGGGGPTDEMLELARRLVDLRGVPCVEVGSSGGFFDRLAAELPDPPTITGELYFEYHRGTYTSQAATKRGNRAGERGLGEAEAAAALAFRLGRAPYPADELRRLWETLLTGQFHDILPGSSIRAVYEEVARDHAAVAAGAARLRGDALQALAADGGEPAPLNLSPFARAAVVEGPDGELTAVVVPPYGFGAAVAPADAVRLDGLVLENAQLRATFDAGGRLTSLVHRPSGREALAAPGNEFELYEDRPTAFDAWELEPYHLGTRVECAPAHAYEVVTDTPLRGELAFEHRIGGGSTLRQLVRLDAGARRLEFHTTVEWAERRRVLKVAFPLLVRAPTATYEMQFGVAERPTHVNTQADLARFEVPGHRFADLSEHGFGVALLTDTTYGYSARGSELRLSLLRGSTDPDPEADLGTHELAYAILPHAGRWQDAGVVAEARGLGQPVHWVGGGAGQFARVGSGTLVLDTIKRAEDGGALVLRLYEPYGARGTATINLGLPFESAARANLLEEAGDPLPSAGDEIEVDYRPFELITVLVG